MGKISQSFWRDKTVLLTGDTGFKGAWLALMLQELGANIIGMALAPEKISLYNTLAPWKKLTSHFIDITHKENVKVFVKQNPAEIMLHLAAQSQVLDSYQHPLTTLNTNCLGTANLLAAATKSNNFKVILCVTSDKVYLNSDSGKKFQEQDPLGGDDIYSASKACAEIIINAWRKSFCGTENAPIIATARAGNVLGGGDWASNRLIPDAARAFMKDETLIMRYPEAVRSWQHVFDVLAGYLLYIEMLYAKKTNVTSLNFSGSEEELFSVQQVVDLFQHTLSLNANYKIVSDNIKTEKQKLLLDPSGAEKAIGWKNKFNQKTAIVETAKWYQAYQQGMDMREYSLQQLRKYFKDVVGN